MVRALEEDADYQRAGERAMLVFEPDMDRKRMQDHLLLLKRRLPDLTVFGMTLLGPLGQDMVLTDRTSFSLLLFESSHVDVQLFDCDEQDAVESGEKLLFHLRSLQNIRGMLVMTSGSDVRPDDFLDVVAGAMPGLPIFGSLSGMKKLNVDDSAVFAGTTILHRAILAVTFCGESLHVMESYSLGWKKLGITHEVTGTRGDYLVDSIDHRPAIELYAKYLNMHPDAQFYENACAFPLLEFRGNMTAARVPVEIRGDGMIRFSMKVREGARICLAYSKPEYVLSDSLSLANRVNRFAPQAIIMFACVNRRIFLHNEDADREIGYLRQVEKNAVTGYGLGEIYRQGQTGGVINSTLVIGALREGSRKKVPLSRIGEPLLEKSREGEIPLNERLVTFLEQTTTELRQKIRELEQIAVVDQLTGIANRRKLDQTSTALLERAGGGPGFTALMFDIDYFKKVNDTYGHLAGDSVLREICSVVQKEIRKSDLLGRWGGEEFVCLFDGISLEETIRDCRKDPPAGGSAPL